MASSTLATTARTLYAATLILLLSVGCAGRGPTGPAPSGAPVEVMTPAGALRGVATGELRLFLGVPFAEAPSGARRFQPPVARARFETPFDASKYGPICPQLPRHELGEPVPPDAKVEGQEDCLNLNVYAHASGGPRPVMVFIHGGGFQQGHGSKAYYEGSALARDAGVVVVTINYRVGALGFFASEELAAESGDKTAGNYGILDQIAALEWVKKNIASLGGDPDDVTIFGESAGGTSVCVLSGSPRASGLFQRAIMESPASCSDLPGLREASPLGRRSGFARGSELIDAAGCKGAADRLACMRGLDPATLVRAGARVAEHGDNLEIYYTPLIDGVVLPEPILERLAKGTADVPIMVGSNADESSMFVLKKDIGDAAAYQTTVRAMFGASAERMLEVYPPTSLGTPSETLRRAVTEVMFGCPARAIAEAASHGPAPAYAYYFDYHRSGRLAEKLGAFHGIELAYLFGTLSDRLKPSDEDRALGQWMRGAWASFAEQGAPSVEPAWPAFDPTKPSLYRIADKREVIADVSEGRCAKLAAP